MSWTALGNELAGRVSRARAAIEEIRSGRFVVVSGATGRWDASDLVIAAERCTPAAVNFMVTHARGVVCVCLTPERCEHLELRPMPTRDGRVCAATVSIEAREGISTGISAHDRSRTIVLAADPAQGRDALVRPGHVFPIRARTGGLLERPGHVEAAVDLARLAGLWPAGVACGILNDDGAIAGPDEIASYCRRHGFRAVDVRDLVAYRRVHVSRAAS